MDDKTDKKNKITWWHLLAAGGGLNLLLGGRDSLTRIIGDILVVVGMGWGILIGVQYFLKKYGKNKTK